MYVIPGSSLFGQVTFMGTMEHSLLLEMTKERNNEMVKSTPKIKKNAKTKNNESNQQINKKTEKLSASKSGNESQVEEPGESVSQEKNFNALLNLYM